ncbi:MAG: DUF493 family protein [Bacteroidetes bacterium]|nr:DUF493 family protein [Bacteroidota bacterium]
MALSRHPSAEAKEWWANFKKLLDDNNEWPGEYIFKFIAPKNNIGDLKAIFIGQKIDIKASSKGTYHSLTTRVVVESSDEIIEIYHRASAVEGVVSL